MFSEHSRSFGAGAVLGARQRCDTQSASRWEFYSHSLGASLAASYSETLFGHHVEIASAEPTSHSEQVLKVDGRELQRNQIISIEEVGRVGARAWQ